MTAIPETDPNEYHLELGDRRWSILHTGAMLTLEDEHQFLNLPNRAPYGAVLWPAAIALAHDIAARGEADVSTLRGRTVLELGAGTGLPGIVASGFGARVTQTDRHELVLTICQANGVRNGANTIAYRQADWSAWDDDTRYDYIVGADVLYATSMHDQLLAIFGRNLAPGGRLLLSDPFRAVSLPILDRLEAAGWRVSMSKWTVGEVAAPRSVGVYEFARD